MRRRAGSKPDGLNAFRQRLPRWLALTCFATMVLAGSGCITTGPMEWVRNSFKVGPNYHKPPAPVAQEWIAAKDAQVQSRHLDDWWQVFDDPALNALVVSAFSQNVSLRIVGARVLEARAQLAIAQGTLFPQIQQATGQYSRTGLSQNMANNPAALNALLASLPGSAAGATTLSPGSIPRNFFSTWSAGFNLSWELDFWGRFRRSIESANASLEASVENFDDALVTLLADVATNYVQYRVTQQRIQIARDNVKIQEGVLALAEDRFRVGTATRLDVEQAKTLLEQTRASIPALKIVLGQANDALCTLLGLPPRDLEPELGPGPAADANPMPSTPTWVAAGIPADLLRRRPDVRSAERQVAAQSAQIGVAEADLYPALSINGTIGLESQDLSRLFESKSFMGTITPAFRWNILNYGRILNNVRLQDARTQELIATYQNKVLTASREVEDALRGFLQSKDQAETLARSVTAAGEATKIGVQQYRTGTIDFNRVFNLETTQVQLQDQRAVAQGNIALNLINAYRALGGGWELRMAKNGGCAAPVSAVPAPNETPAAPSPMPGPDRPARLGEPQARITPEAS
jgi:NodT family efflux transporter outer membrane factor (OMF) lipoprotein